jgi:carboxypeptidase A1
MYMSEPENQAIGTVMQGYVGRIGVYLATHTCGDMMLWPYGWTYGSFVTNWQEHQSVGEEAAAGIMALTGTEYIVGNGADVLGTAYGAGDDYGYVFGRARLSYTLELRCGGSWWFDLPANEMQEVAHETFIIYQTMGRFSATT